MADELMELIGIKVPPSMRLKIEDLAEADKRPLSSMARILLEEAIDARDNEQKLYAGQQDVRAKKAKKQ